jgi:succinylarginine dihydrolase
MSAVAAEVNFDGLVGPTHNYGGLAKGNLASAENAHLVSNPREAALQGLAKMRALGEMGIAQAVLPPHERPHIPSLRHMGFVGSDAEIIAQAARVSPLLLAHASSASAMWTANAATVTPSADAADGRVHLTPANLFSHFHRAIETPTTTRILRTIFADPSKFEVHDAIPFPTFGDEGAANHCRFARTHAERGVELFVYGRSAFMREPGRLIEPRQAYEASQIIITNHGLQRGGVVLARQSQEAINAGAFHNDVVAVSNQNVFMFHEQAFEDREGVLNALKAACSALGFELLLLEAKADEISLEDAVSSYLFNSQVLTLPQGGMALILPVEARENDRTRAFVERAMASNGPLREAYYMDLRQSMMNGGGPACLRLRVVLTEPEWESLGARVLLEPNQVSALEGIVNARYRDRLAPGDLADPLLLDESRQALDEISYVLGLGSVYDFQRT